VNRIKAWIFHFLQWVLRKLRWDMEPLGGSGKPGELMLLQGVHPKVVSERLGHASVGITLDLYSHVLPSMQQDAVRAFDELFP